MARTNTKAKRFAGYQVLWLLKEHNEPYTILEVAAELGCAPNCAYRHLRELWSLELIHICNWDRTYRHWMPVYRWGNKADKPRPEPLTAKEVRARRQQPDVVKRAIRLVYQQNYSKGVTWQEALGDHKRRER